MAFNKNKVLEGARKYVEKGQTDKAIKEYLRVVKEDPNDVRVWLKIGDLYAKKGSKAEAIDTYLKVARFYSEQGFFLKAVAVYKQILKLDSRLIEVNLKLAELYRQLGLMSDAMRHFESVAGHFHREGKTREALATVRQLVELDPENVATRIKLAELYSKEGMVEEAVTEFTQACEYLRVNNRQDDFVKVAERLLWHRPDNIDLNRELAGLYLRRNDPRRALQKLQICFKANSRDVETLALLAQAFQALEQKSKAVQVLKELGRVLDEDGKRDRAREVYRKILAFVPNDPDSLAYLGPATPGRPADALPPSVPPSPSGLGPPSVPPPPEISPRVLASQDVAPRRRHNPTGSMPLVDARAISMISQHGRLIPEFSSGLEADVAPGEGSASAERHAEEIVKLLTETEVYVKYGLHPRAIEHLRRVFELDPQNIEARERLKEILLAQGREREAVQELMRLAEMTAMRDADRASSYLRELLGIDRTYQPAFQLAERFHLDLIGVSGEIEIVDDRTDLRDGAIEVVDDDLELEDIDLEEAEEDSIIGVGAGTTQGYGEVEAPSYEFDLDDGGAAVAPAAGYVDFDPADAAAFDAEPGYDPTSARAYRPDAEFGGTFDPGPTSVFDGFGGGRPTDVTDAPDLDAGSFLDLNDFALDFEFAPDQRPTADLTAARTRENEIEEPTRLGHVHSVDTNIDLLHGRLADEPGAAPVDAVEDELDEVDFFITQGLFDAARDVIEGLLLKYPEDPLLLSRLQDIANLTGGVADPTAALTVGAMGHDESFGDRAHIETTASGSALRAMDSRPVIMLQKPVEDSDADTHFDLGLAYKEMGLYDEAIKAFIKVAEVPEREVQSLLMIGLCYREQAQITDAINHFKHALHSSRIVEREQLNLYYEIAMCYDMLGDPKETVYYYTLIRKRDPNYRDVAQRMATMRSGQGGSEHGRPPTDDDAVIDSLFMEPDPLGRRG